MDAFTVPRSFEDTTPAEVMKDFSKQPKSQSQTPILSAATQPAQNYRSISPTSSRFQLEETPENESNVQGHAESNEETKRPWFGKRIWTAIRQWEEDHVELVLENKQSVARDHLGI